MSWVVWQALFIPSVAILLGPVAFLMIDNVRGAVYAYLGIVGGAFSTALLLVVSAGLYAILLRICGRDGARQRVPPS
jgi:hypothetical protein